MALDPLPTGPPVPPRPIARLAPDKIHTGGDVTLRPVHPDEDAAALYDGSHGTDQAHGVWTYMSYGPFASKERMLDWLRTCARSSDPLFLTVLAHGRPVGMASFLNIVPEMRRLELGHIWYVPAAQQTKVNTEAMYLMLGEAFDALRYRRVEWKCDALNARSRAAARRLGFRFEGLFQNHLIVKGRNRDTAWYAMTDAEWPAIKANMERWLYSGEAGLSLAELNAPFVRHEVVDR